MAPFITYISEGIWNVTRVTVFAGEDATDGRGVSE
jgi:hypothetical protein